MPGESDDAARRVLPYDIDFRMARPLGATHSPERPPNPPSHAELIELGLVAPRDDPDRWFNSQEKQLADWLRRRGIGLLSVRRRMGEHERTPDAVITNEPVTVELKYCPVASVTGIVRAVRLGRGQSRRVVVDVRGPRADPALALAAIGRALRYYGFWLDEIVVVVTEGQSIGWWHGRNARSE